jgi:Tol biopolymer transport system component
VPETRSALIVATYDYEDPGLTRLRAPARDAEALSDVLGDPAIGGFEVHSVVNQPAHVVNVEVARFFANRRPDDLLLLHFSCHGVKDDSGELYFATPDTRLDLMEATAVSSAYVNKVMTRSRSMRVVLLLDCCYAGAFARGMTSRGGPGLDLSERLGGRGRAVIAASTAMQFAFEGPDLADGNPEDVPPSVFTSALVEGLRTGDADRDLDGVVSLDELYGYVYDEVTAATPNQTPGKWAFGLEGDLLVARRSTPVRQASALPDAITGSLESAVPWERESVIPELERLLVGRHPGRALAARNALEQLTDDDSRRVAVRARTALGAVPEQGVAPPEETIAPKETGPPPPEETPPAREETPSAREETPPRSDEPAPAGLTGRRLPRRSQALAAAGIGVLAAVALVVWLLGRGAPENNSGGGSGDSGGSGGSGGGGAASGTFGNVVVVSTATEGSSLGRLSAVEASTGRPANVVPSLDGGLPVISPDRHWLAYVAPDASGNEVRLRSADGKYDKPLVAHPSGDTCAFAGRPAWSPDSTELAVPCVHADQVGRTLYVVDRSSGAVRNEVLTSPDLRGGVAWERDRIVYPKVDTARHVTALWSVPVGDHQTGTQITHPDSGADFWPDWSQPTQRLVFQRASRMKGVGEIWTANADGAHAREESKGTRFNGHLSAPHWAPDGTELTYLVTAGDGSTDLWRGLTGSPVRLVDSNGTLGPPAW